MFQLLLDLRGVVDHGVFNGKAAVGSQDALVVRRTVLARIGDLARLHGGFGLVEIPAIGPGAGKSDGIQRVQVDEVIHHGAGHEVNIFQRLAQLHGSLREDGKLRRSLGPDKELVPRFRDREQNGAVGINIRRELPGIIQRVSVVQHKGIRGGRGLLLPAAAGRQGQGSRREGFEELTSVDLHGISSRSGR